MVGSLNSNTDLLKTKLNDFVASTKVYKSPNENKWTTLGGLRRMRAATGTSTSTVSIDGKTSFTTYNTIRMTAEDNEWDNMVADDSANYTNYAQHPTPAANHPLLETLTIGPFPLATNCYITGMALIGTDDGNDHWTLRLFRDNYSTVLAQFKSTGYLYPYGRAVAYYLHYQESLPANTVRTYMFFPRYDGGTRGQAGRSDLNIVVVPSTNLLI